MRALAEALRFLSLIPIPGRPPAKESAVLAAYPWAALILGLITAVGTWIGAWILSVAGTAILAVILRILVSGGLHLDGLADVADSLGGGRDREKRMTIMADSRLGSFGVLALISMFAMQAVLIGEILSTTESSEARMALGHISLKVPAALVLTPVITRGIIPLMMRLFPSARPGGMGDRIRLNAKPAAVAASLTSVMLIAGAFFGISGVLLATTVLLLMLIIAGGISRGLGGLTGDVYGALIEIGDLAVLLGLLVIFRFEMPADGLMSLFS